MKNTKIKLTPTLNQSRSSSSSTHRNAQLGSATFFFIAITAVKILCGYLPVWNNWWCQVRALGATIAWRAVSSVTPISSRYTLRPWWTRRTGRACGASGLRKEMVKNHLAYFPYRDVVLRQLLDA